MVLLPITSMTILKWGFKMKFTTEIIIPKNNLDYINKCLSSTPEEMEEPKSEGIIRYTGKFDNGNECDIILHSSDDDFYVDGVLYDGNGCACVCTDVCDDVLGVWKFEYEDNEYECIVKSAEV